MQFWKTLRQTTWFLFLLMVVSIVLMVVDTEESPWQFAFPVYLLFAGLAGVRLLRAVWIIQQIVMVLFESEDLC